MKRRMHHQRTVEARKKISREDIESRIDDLSTVIDDPDTDVLKRLSAIEQRIQYKKLLKQFG